MQQGSIPSLPINKTAPMRSSEIVYDSQPDVAGCDSCRSWPQWFGCSHFACTSRPTGTLRLTATCCLQRFVDKVHGALQVSVYEEKAQVGGACKTEYPFKNAPQLGTSTGSIE